MLAASQHHSTQMHSFSDPDGGVYLACGISDTFRLSSGRAPWFEDDQVVGAVCGSLRTRDEAVPDHARTAELLSALIEGREDSSAGLDGYFSIAAWDRLRRRLHLVSDPLGKQPLYYFSDALTSLLVFATELKAVLAHPSVPREVNRAALPLYLGMGFIPAPFTLAQGVKKLTAAQALSFSEQSCETRVYWRPQLQALPDDLTALQATMEDAVKDAVEGMMGGAEEVAVFLSGGLDSSVVLAALKESTVPRVAAFNLSYESSSSGAYDRPWAERIAANLDVPLTSVVISPERDVTPEVISETLGRIDEPFESAGRALSEYFLLHAARADGFNSCASGGGAGFIFGRWRLNRHAATMPEDETLAQTLAYFMLDRSLFDSERQSRMLAFEYDDSVLEAAVEAYLPLLSGLSHMQGVTLVRSLLAPTGRLGLFGAFLPPLYGLEERSPYYARRIVEISLSLPPRSPVEKIGLKGPLNLCFRDQIGVDFTKREKRAFPSAPLPEWLRASIVDRLETLVDARIIRKDYLTRLRAKYNEGRERAQREAWQLFVLACWYRAQILGESAV
jgi:asparagine synthase (glutamine-hydrolysing)